MKHKRRRLNPTSTIIFDPFHREYEFGSEIIEIGSGWVLHTMHSVPSNF
jgi:hypothetical protein